MVFLGLVLAAGILLWQGQKSVADKEGGETTVVTSGDEPQPGSEVHDLPVSPAVAAARAHLAERLSIETKSILVLSAFEKDWPNSCLGLEEAGEFCAQVIIPGFEVKMKAQGQVYIYRANVDGSVIKAEN
ncbi:MAG: hypothetical protein Q8P04_01430 [bacterium]|nr:hypothetical protein [bacterium]